MRAAFKYPIKTCGLTKLSLPEGAEFLSAASQFGDLYAWMLVDPAKPLCDIFLRTDFTGEATVEDNDMWLATVHISEESVVHVYLVKDERYATKEPS